MQFHSFNGGVREGDVKPVELKKKESFESWSRARESPSEEA